MLPSAFINGFLLIILVDVGIISSAVARTPVNVVKNQVIADQEHFLNREHRSDYDHEAFLGDEAKAFDQLTPDESKRRLGIIVDKIDKNNDSEVSREELKDWIKFTQERYFMNDVDKNWKLHDVDGNKKNLTWNEYRTTVYGFNEDWEAVKYDKNKEMKDDFSFVSILGRDKRRWDSADIDNDGVLTKAEFVGFLHPDQTDHLKQLVILETMEDMDKDGDGRINLQEYIGDMYSEGLTDDTEPPEWVQNEIVSFNEHQDKNGDGFLDETEVRNWLMPMGFDAADVEAGHLIDEADSNGDERLTKEEILVKFDVFVGSQVTDFGDAFSRHDEF